MNKKGAKTFVEPLRNMEDIKALTDYFRKHTKETGQPDFIIWLLCINMGFRIGDALKLRVSQICGTGKKVRSYIEIKEQKTDKVVNRPIPPEIKQALQEYIDSLRWEKGGVKFQSYLFESKRKPGTHYCKEWMNNRLKIAAAACGIEQRIATHTMRKTFAYWTYMTHKDNREEFATERECLEFISASIMRHSSAKVTLRYIGLEQEKIERITGKAIVK